MKRLMKVLKEHTLFCWFECKLSLHFICWLLPGLIDKSVILTWIVSPSGEYMYTSEEPLWAKTEEQAFFFSLSVMLSAFQSCRTFKCCPVMTMSGWKGPGGLFEPELWGRRLTDSCRRTRQKSRLIWTLAKPPLLQSIAKPVFIRQGCIKTSSGRRPDGRYS